MGINVSNQPDITPSPPPGGAEGGQPLASEGLEKTILEVVKALAGTSGTEAASTVAGPGGSDVVVGGSIEKVKESYSSAIDNPNLSKPNESLLQSFNSCIKKLSDNTGVPEGGILPCGKNSWFTPGAVLMLFVILTGMAAIMAQMAREEAKVDITLTNMLMSMAKEIASLILSQGEVAAKKLTADAMKSITEGIVACGQIFMSAVSVMYQTGKIEEEKQKFITNKKQELLSNPTPGSPMAKLSQEADLAAIGPPPGRTGAAFDNARREWISKNTDENLNRLAQPSTKDMLKIQTNVSQVQTALFKEVYNGVFTAVKSFASAGIDVQKAEYERRQAMIDKTRTLIDKLYDIISKTERKLDSDSEGVRKTLQDMLGKLREVIQLQGKYWSQSAG